MGYFISVVPWQVGGVGSTMGDTTVPIQYDNPTDINGNQWYYSQNTPFLLVWNPISRTLSYSGTALPHGSGVGSGPLPVGNLVFISAGFNNSGGTIVGYTADLSTGNTQNSLPKSGVMLPWSITYDGSRVYILDRVKRLIYQLNSSTGAVLNVFGPFGIGSTVLDGIYNDGGSHIWAFDDFTYGGTGNIFVVSTSSGLLTNTISPPVGFQFDLNGPTGVYFDGTFMWIEAIGMAGFPTILCKYSLSGTLLAQCTLLATGTPGNTFGGPISFDGTYIWAVSGGQGYCYNLINPSTCTIFLSQGPYNTIVGGEQINFSGFLSIINNTDVWSPVIGSSPAFATSARLVYFDCNSPPVAPAGIFYTHTFPTMLFTAPLTFSLHLGTIPPGTSLNTSTGVISGTPITLGFFNFSLKVIDSLGYNAIISCQIHVTGGGSPPLNVFY